MASEASEAAVAPGEGAAAGGAGAASEGDAAIAESEATRRLWDICCAAQADLEAARASLGAADCDASWQEASTGESLLMRAAGAGHLELVQLLLEHGAPWNALDRKGLCAGQHALEAGHQAVADALVDAGVRAEMVLGAIESRKVERGPASNEEYLGGAVEYTADDQKLMEPSGDAVMMEWERPLMQLHAQVLCAGGVGEAASPERAKERHVLNVGFGMGIVDSYLQEFGAGRHTIIEAHPTVFAKMKAEGWDRKPGVTIRFGRWQDVVPTLADADFDGIFFDTFGEYYADMKAFHAHLPRLLKPGGLYSFFNGLCPRNIFFHGVACQVVQLELARLGLAADFVPCEIDAGAHADATWDGVRRRYWWNDTYYLPVCRRLCRG